MIFFPKQALYSTSLFVISLVCAFVGTSCSSGVKEENPQVLSIPKPAILASEKLVLSEKPEDKALCESLDKIIADRDAPNEKWGMMFVSLSDGRVLCARDARGLYLPASVQKLVTSAAALEKLGPGYRFRTSVFAKREIENGILDSDLVLYGRGAPDFDKTSLTGLVRDLKKKGLKTVKGDIVGDSSYFKADALGDGWTWNEAQWYYGAAATALSYERNLVTISIRNGKPTADSGYIELTGELQPVGDIEAIGIKRKLGTNRVYVWGNGKDLEARIAISDPALFTARVFRETLAAQGIDVQGEVRSADWTKPTGAAEGTELTSAESSQLGELVGTMNRDSVNLYAEVILRTLGKKFGAEAPDPNPRLNKLRGDDLAGASVVKELLAENGIDSSTLAIHDGSGLSRLARMTPESIARTLIFSAQSNHSKVFTDSLPVAATSGTLRGRLKGVAGLVSAKTGSIKYANSLAGFARRDDETIAFVIICNDETTRTDSTATIDAIVLKIAR